MKMKCIIIEDQPPAQRILKRYAEDTGSLQVEAVFSDALQAIDYLKRKEVDLIFLDIHLPKISGMDFLKSIPNLPPIILTTAFPDYALESYEFNVVDYLLKPFSFERFIKAISKIPLKNQADSFENQSFTPKEIFIKSGYEHIKVTVDDINYIQSDADYTELITVSKKYLSSETLQYWLDHLNPNQFVRIHKSYIVNVSKIEKVGGNRIFLSGGAVIPIGRTYKEGFIKKFIEQA